MINVKTSQGIRALDPDKLTPRRPQPNRGVNRVVSPQPTRQQYLARGFEPFHNHLRKQHDDGTTTIVLMGNLKP